MDTYGLIDYGVAAVEGEVTRATWSLLKADRLAGCGWRWVFAPDGGRKMGRKGTLAHARSLRDKGDYRARLLCWYEGTVPM